MFPWRFHPLRLVARSILSRTYSPECSKSINLKPPASSRITLGDLTSLWTRWRKSSPKRTSRSASFRSARHAISAGYPTGHSSRIQWRLVRFGQSHLTARLRGQFLWGFLRLVWGVGSRIRPTKGYRCLGLDWGLCWPIKPYNSFNSFISDHSQSKGILFSTKRG